MKTVEHLLVDLDGTLVHGDSLAMRWHFVSGLTRTWNDRAGIIKTFRALHQMRLSVENPSAEFTNEVRMVRAFAKSFRMGETEARDLLESAVLRVFPTLERFFVPVPGAKEFLNWASVRYPLILATNPIWIPQAVALRVEWAGLDLELFRSFTHAKRMHACKPSLEYYRELIDMENLDPSSCLLVGNDYRKDLPAIDLGIRVFLLSNHPGSPRPVNGKALAWAGSFLGLRGLLEERAEVFS